MTPVLSLAGVGWVADKPTGNRLRWSLPEDAADAGHHLQPEWILVERAPLDIKYDPRSLGRFGPAAAVPPQLWTQLGDVTLAGFMPVAQSLGGSVQAVRFAYDGTPALVQAFDGDRCVLTQAIVDGETVVLQAAAMDLLTITTPFCKLGGLATLDLYATPPLQFEVIAEIGVAATATAPFADAIARYPAPPTLDPARWDELQALWSRAWAEAVGAPGQDGAPNAWHELQIVLAARWEHAVACGLGFVDGPDGGASTLDRSRDLLTGPRGSAYRVRDKAGRLAPSNVVCIPGGAALDLAMLPAPTIEQGAVRLGESGTIRASWDVAWKSPQVAIVGVQVKETRVVDGGATGETYDARGRLPTDPPGTGRVHREEEVVGPDVAIAASVRPEDGFDRLGPWSPGSPLTPLPIDHHPQPPPLRSATNDGATATLDQSPPGTWAPDAIVALAGGRVRFHRRTAQPARFEATVTQVLPIGELVAVSLAGAPPPNPAAFLGGPITVGQLKGTVSQLAWPAVIVAAPHGTGPVVAPLPGTTATLVQSATDPALFTQVHEQAAAGLPATIAFVDPLPAPVSAEILEYRAQVAFGALLGPMGPAVQALRLPVTPNVPPPFTITTLGVDFYNRTLVQLELTVPSGDLLDVAWADGDVPAADFPQRAVPGDAGARPAEGGRILFDTLSLPVPKMVERTVTIGVQAVNAADGRSGFATVTHTLPASP
ncbi:MAG TPA: hypothetical protein VFD90_07225 [Gaiellales bacterium]|nr:hypothetical protein [Gaiellales bacterium]